MNEITLSSPEFKALSSENRVKILKLLDERNHTLTELAKKLDISSTSAKQHLEVLGRSKLIEQMDEGRKWKYYTLTRKGKKLVEAKETQTTVLILLSVASIALVGVLMLLFNALAPYMGASETGALPTEPARILPLDTIAKNGETGGATTAQPIPPTPTLEQQVFANPAVLSGIGILLVIIVGGLGFYLVKLRGEKI